jgi:hypothetical protein
MLIGLRCIGSAETSHRRGRSIADVGRDGLIESVVPSRNTQCGRSGLRSLLESAVCEHGRLLDENTIALMAERGVWWCLQPFLDDAPALAPANRGSSSRW